MIQIARGQGGVDEKEIECIEDCHAGHHQSQTVGEGRTAKVVAQGFDGRQKRRQSGQDHLRTQRKKFEDPRGAIFDQATAFDPNRRLTGFDTFVGTVCRFNLLARRTRSH